MNERGHLSAETLDLLMLAALSSPESESAKVHIDKCTACQARWTELEEDKKRFEQFVFPRTLPKIQERAKPVSFWAQLRERWQLAMPAVGLAAAAVLLAVVVMPRVAEEDPYFGEKGPSTPTMELVASRGDTQFPVRSNTLLKAGDRIRFMVHPAGAKYLLIASKDGEGKVTLYYPYAGDRSAEVRATDRHEVPGAIELDAAGGRERVFAFFSDEQLAADPILKAIDRGQEDVALLPGVKGVVVKDYLKERP